MSLRNVALAAVFAALAAFVAAGALSGFDQWSVDHLMPGAHFRHERTGLLQAVVPLYRVRWSSAYAVAVNIVTLPASVVPSFLIVVWCSRRLAVVLVAADLVELLCKHVLTRPALYHGALHITAFDSSFPSGHALRTVIVAAAVAQRRPRSGPLALVWAVASIGLLLVAGWHTPTDLAGGVLLGLLGAAAAGALRRRRLRT